MEPDDLIARLEEARSTGPPRLSKPWATSFQAEPCRFAEIALRRTADRLNRTARKQHPEGFLNPSDHILVCLSSAPSNAKSHPYRRPNGRGLSRRFYRSLRGDSGYQELSGENRKRLRANLKLAEDLGARIATVYGDDPAAQIADYSRTSGVTKNRARPHQPPPAARLVEQESPGRPAHRAGTKSGCLHYPGPTACLPPQMEDSPSELSFSWKDTGKMLGILAAATLLGSCFPVWASERPILSPSIFWGCFSPPPGQRGRLYGILSSLLSVLTFNFFSLRSPISAWMLIPAM